MKVIACILLVALASLAHAEEPPAYIFAWGSQGSAQGQFGRPEGIGTDPNDDVYVVDSQLNRVTHFTPQGGVVCSVGGAGSGDGQFDMPVDVAFANAGVAYISDAQNQRVVRMTAGCVPDGGWPFGTSSPGYLAIDRTRKQLYSTVNNFAVVFDLTGAFKTSWTFLSYSTGPTRFGLGPSGLLYFPDQILGTVRVYRDDGTFVVAWSGAGAGDSTLTHPDFVTVDSHENIYVFDGPRIKKFTSTGVFLTAWGEVGTGPGQYSQVTDVCVDSHDNVYVTDAGGYRVLEFGPVATPSIRTSWGSLKQHYR